MFPTDERNRMAEVTFDVEIDRREGELSVLYIIRDTWIFDLPNDLVDGLPLGVELEVIIREKAKGDTV